MSWDKSGKILKDYNFSPDKKTIDIRGVYFHIRRSGGFDLTSSLEAKFGARSSQVHQIRGKAWQVLLLQDAKVGKNPNFGVISEIQRAKFWVLVTYIFEGKIWRSDTNSRGKFWGKSPRPTNMNRHSVSGSGTCGLTIFNLNAMFPLIDTIFRFDLIIFMY